MNPEQHMDSQWWVVFYAWRNVSMIADTEDRLREPWSYAETAISVHPIEWLIGVRKEERRKERDRQFATRDGKPVPPHLGWCLRKYRIVSCLPITAEQFARWEDHLG